MPEVALTRRIRFSAAHRYHRPEWDEARNRAEFGACANPHGHGHNYVLLATVQGPLDPETGFCVSLPALDGLLRDAVAALDHQHLNHAVPEFAPGGQIPSTENLVLWLWRRVEPGVLAPARLVRLRLHEDEDLYAEYPVP